MVNFDEADTISVTLASYPDRHETVAEFVWPFEQPVETYTIDIDEISVEFCRHYLVRPKSVRQLHGHSIGNETVLDELFGTEFSEAMQSVRKTGFLVMQLSLAEHQRNQLTELQYHSPSTPSILREAAAKRMGTILARDADESNGACDDANQQRASAPPADPSMPELYRG